MNGLGVELFAGAALRGQQDRRVRGRRPLGQGLDSAHVFAHGHDGVKGVPGGVGFIYPAEHLLVSFFIGLQLCAEVVGVPDKGDHRQPAGHCAVQKEGIHIDEVDVVVFLHTGGVENGLSRGQHLWKPRSRAHLPQGAAQNLRFRLFQKVQIVYM